METLKQEKQVKSAQITSYQQREEALRQKIYESLKEYCQSIGMNDVSQLISLDLKVMDILHYYTDLFKQFLRQQSKLNNTRRHGSTSSEVEDFSLSQATNLYNSSSRFQSKSQPSEDIKSLSRSANHTSAKTTTNESSPSNNSTFIFSPKPSEPPRRNRPVTAERDDGLALRNKDLSQSQSVNASHRDREEGVGHARKFGSSGGYATQDPTQSKDIYNRIQRAQQALTAMKE